MSGPFDAIVIGAGPAGEVCAGELADAGWRVAIVERELVAGECSYWACMPSKALLAPGDVQARALRTPGVRGAVGRLDVQDVLAFRDEVVSGLDDRGQVEWLEDKGVTLIRGTGRLGGRGRVLVDGTAYETDRIVVATGSSPAFPPIEGLSELPGVWTNREATGARSIPGSLIVLGGGAVGVEMAQAFARLGAEVTVLESAPRLLDGEVDRAGELLADRFRAEGIRVELETRITATAMERGDYLLSSDGGRRFGAEKLFIATGRTPRAYELGLETVGVEVEERGIPVDERCRAADGLWAIGDCTGVGLLTHLGKYQARIAAEDMLGRPARADYRAVPRIVFTDPQVASVGDLAAEHSATVELGEVARSSTWSRPAPEGFVTLFSDGSRITGATAVGPEAGEWLGQATLAVTARLPIEVLEQTIQPFPTFSEALFLAARKLRRSGGSMADGASPAEARASR